VRVVFKNSVPENGVRISIYSKKFVKKNKKLFSGVTFEMERNKKTLVCSGDRLEVMVGLDDTAGAVELERLGWGLLRYIRSNRLKDISLLLNNCEDEENNDERLFSLLVGMELSDYRFDKYLTGEKKAELETFPKSVTVVARNEREMAARYREFSLLRDNVFFCRDLVNEPSNSINPESYSKICKDLEEYGLEVEILGEEQMRRLGMNMLLSVGNGSSFESKVVLLRWKGLEKFENPIALVGKGVTFDSGGISLKPGKSMYDMKCDMAGSAVVVSTMKLLAERKARLNSIGIIGLVENMPSSDATKPGDIVTSLSGQTVEILNTDAEGRLVLGDILYYVAREYKPDVIIDLATLTWSMAATFGPYRAGVFSSSEVLSEEICKAAEITGEYCWKMPLDKIGGDYDKMIDSSVADMKNIFSGGHSGAITAAQFLQRFVDKHKKWAHIDIAGTAFVDNEKCFFVNSGATGYGVRLIDNLLRNNYEE
jgi:leucyl aminopeptidase